MRVVSNDGPLIQRVLDLGAYGVVVPRINNAREAEAAVRAMRYSPKGDRSWGRSAARATAARTTTPTPSASCNRW